MNVEERALEQLIQELVEMLRGIRESGQFEVQSKRSLRKNDGKYAQLFDESAMGLTGMLGDITEQKLAAVLIDRAAAKYRHIFENSVEGIFQCTWDGRFIVANPACARILGCASPEELIVQDSAGDRPYFVDPERYKELQRLLQEKGLVKGYEAEVYRKDGSKIWISANTWAMRDASGGAVFYQGTMEDITEEKFAKEKLRESEEKYRSILESIEDGYFEVDLAGNFTFLNESLCKILGQSRDELMGVNNRQYMDKENARKVFETFNQVYTTGQAVKATDWILLRKDGTRRFVETSTSLMRNRDGTPKGFQGIARDITDRKRTEEALNKAKLSEEASKAKGKFLANMSHEIRTPLNAIIGMTELAMDGDLEDSLRHSLLTITREADALLVIINEILDFSKIEAGKIKLEEIPFDLSVTMESVAENIAFQAGQKGVGFRYYRSPDLPSRFMGDPGRLRQILLNLSGNALKFTDRGEIGIKAEMAENLGERVKIRFSVTDTGIGIPEDKQTAIFESFAQADGSTTRKYGGTGLGLAISKRLAELMGGEIGVESEEGKGSTFWFTAVFARLTDEATPATFTRLQGGELAAAEEGLRWPGRILLAEDYQTNQLVITEQINRAGCKVVLAENGKKAVELFAAGDFDLIFMDVHMPEMDGLTAARLIRKQEEGREKRTPIIALTASVLAADHQACHDAGMDDFLEKPLKRRNLLVMLKKWLGSGEIDPLYRRRPEEGTESGVPDSLPGLDIRKAMAALACDPAMYRKIAASFFQENLDTVKAMRDAFAVQDWATLERLAHSLKSTSAAIGARTLPERALELEKSSREAEAVPPAPDLIDQIETAYRQVMGSLTSLVQSDRREPAPRLVKQLDPEALAPILGQFAKVITITDVDGIQAMLETLKNHCGDEAVARLENQLDSYDYDDALETLREIAGRIGVTISLNP